MLFILSLMRRLKHDVEDVEDIMENVYIEVFALDLSSRSQVIGPNQMSLGLEGKEYSAMSLGMHMVGPEWC